MAVAKKSLLVFLGVIIFLCLLLIIPDATADKTNKDKQASMESIQRFSDAITQIKRYYINTVGDEQLFDDAIEGMLEGLDPYSTYLDEDDFETLRTTTEGKFGGLGLEITQDDTGLIKVVTPLADTPAAKAGIRSGDTILRVNETDVRGMPISDVVNMLRGKRGTKVNLTILHQGSTTPVQLKVTREVIKLKSIRSQLIDKQYGYVRITHFQTLTAKNLIKAINNLKKEAGGSLQGLILDLRNNPGGLFDSAIAVSDVFIHNDQRGAEELIVTTRGRVPGTNFVAFAKPGDILNNAPIIVLINQGSASAAEIVAGALKDNQRAITVGTQSFGKGSIQTLIPLDKDHGIKLTTALYYTPAGHSIQDKGITPDVYVEDQMTPESHQANLQKNDTQLLEHDYQLREALNVLKSLTQQ